MKKTVVLIGGGITGLATAYFLKEQLAGSQHRCILIEADTRWGGKILTDRVNDFIIEGGPDSFLSQKPGGIALCRALGLTDQIVQTDPIHKTTFLLREGIKRFPDGMNLMIPGRITPFLLTSLISPSGKARMGLDLLIPRKSETEDESIASFVRRRFGDEAVSLFAEPILATIYAGDAEKLSLRATFPTLAQLEREFGSLIWGMAMKKWDAHLSRLGQKQEVRPPWTLFVTLRNGLTTLVQSLVEKLDRVDLRWGQKVTAISPSPQRGGAKPPNTLCSVTPQTSVLLRRPAGAVVSEWPVPPPQEGGYTITLPDETLHADAVVIATDAATAARFIKPWDKPLASDLAAIPYVSTATVSLGFRREDVTHPLNGFGFVVAQSEKKHILAVTWSSTKFSGRADSSHVLIRSFLGGAHHEEDADLTDNQLIEIVKNELGPLLGICGQPIVARVFKWIKGNPQYNVGHLDKVAAIEKAAENHPGLFLTGAAYKGVGIPDCIAQGEETAKRVARFIREEREYRPSPTIS